ncbi:MAG: hypothetical protein ACRENK_16410 [Gemmatimonadaceae bacterium]
MNATAVKVPRFEQSMQQQKEEQAYTILHVLEQKADNVRVVRLADGSYRVTALPRRGTYPSSVVVVEKEDMIDALAHVAQVLNLD